MKGTDVLRLIWLPACMLTVLAVLLLLSGCVGMVNDYATAANAFSEQATLNTITQLERKHDTELTGYLVAACGQPRAGALMRRFSDDEELRRYFEFCREQRGLMR